MRTWQRTGLAILAAAVASTAAVTRAEEPVLAPECPPFAATPLAPAAAVRELGIVPSLAPGRPTDAAIVSLAEPHVGASSPLRGEALLALPKRADGRVAPDLELAPGVRIASSYFSAILCSTVVRVVGPASADADALVRRLPRGSAVVRNDVYRTAAGEIQRSGPDPYRSFQYGLDQSQVDAARSVTDGSGARVALLDSAADPRHLELVRVRVVALAGGPATTPATHGSLLAGVMAAIEHNAFGIEGIAPGAEIVSIPVCTPAAAGTSDECKLSDLLRGVDLAWEQRAQVVNLSLVGPENPLLGRAMDRLDQLGVVLVAAVGNEGSEEPRYPAAYPSVIGVGAVDRDGRIYARSNRGSSVEVWAPGVEIVSTVPGDQFAFGDGTSLAAAHVSGLLALAVAASGDPLAARTAFFQVARERGALPVMVPPICDVLARLGKPCAKP